MMTFISRLALCAALLLTAGAATAADWPQWRGPERNGISKETGLLKQWPAAGPKVLWEAPLGPGYSSPVIAGGKVYTMHQDKKNQYLVALDEATGKEAWKVATGKLYKSMTRHNGPRSTPTVEDGLVYALDGGGNLVCVKAADGALVWKKNIIELAGANNLLWGMAGSPHLSGEMLVVNPGGKNASVMALNKKTGEIIWKSGSEKAGYSTVVDFKGDGVDQFVVFTGISIGGYAAKDGKLLWRLPWKTSYDVNAANPVVTGDRILVSSGYGTGCALIEPKGGQVKVIWKNKKIDVQFGPTPLVRDGFVYGTNNKAFVCLDAATGEGRWEHKGVKGAQMIWADGLVYALSEDGFLRLARMTPEKCEIISEVRIFDGAQRWCTPTVANGKLFLRDDQKMLCLDITKR